jgi:hypothetical protein
LGFCFVQDQIDFYVDLPKLHFQTQWKTQMQSQNDFFRKFTSGRSSLILQLLFLVSGSSIFKTQ